jgi:hypothetical protein
MDSYRHWLHDHIATDYTPLSPLATREFGSFGSEKEVREGVVAHG